MPKITYGICNVYAAKITVSGSSVSYGSPVELPGASELTLQTQGEEVKIYASDVVYYRDQNNQGYSGNLNLYNIPDSFYKDYLGYIEDTNGVLVESDNAPCADFALIFEFKTDNGAQTKRAVLYNCHAARPQLSGKTKGDTIAPEPFSIPITASPAIDTGYVKASVLGDATNTTWSGWLSAVYTPVLASAETNSNEGGGGATG